MNEITEFTEDPKELALMACKALLRQQPVAMLLPDDWERPEGFPLPIKAHKDTLAREYRPLAILEWVNDTMAARVQATRTKARSEE